MIPQVVQKQNTQLCHLLHSVEFTGILDHGVCEGMLTVQAAAEQQNALSTEGTQWQLGLAVTNTTLSLRELCFSEGMQIMFFSMPMHLRTNTSQDSTHQNCMHQDQHTLEQYMPEPIDIRPNVIAKKSQFLANKESILFNFSVSSYKQTAQ